MTVANDQHAKECEMEHQSEGVLMEELGRLLGEVKASARSVAGTPTVSGLAMCCKIASSGHHGTTLVASLHTEDMPH